MLFTQTQVIRWVLLLSAKFKLGTSYDTISVQCQMINDTHNLGGDNGHRNVDTGGEGS